MARSLVGVFDQMQASEGRPCCGRTTAAKWLAKERPDTTISPLKLDYCNTCMELYTEIKRQQQIANRLRESGNAQQEDVAAHDTLAKSYRLLLAEHKEIAQASIDEYKEAREKSTQDYQRIAELQKNGCANEEEEEELMQKKANLNVCVHADYQQAKLIPHWGYTPQPGTTYYKQKLSNDIFGVVVHNEPVRRLYTWHEGAAGAKTSDHTITCLDDCIGKLEAWVQHVTIVVDNAQINKNQYVVNWMQEVARSGRFKSLRLILMVPGHTKFSPDELFARLSHSYYRQDVFRLEDLRAIASRYGEATTLDGTSIMLWKDELSKAYSAIPDIKKQRDFLVKQAASDETSPSLFVRERNYQGEYKKVVSVNDEAAAAEVRPQLQSYVSQDKSPGIQADKLEHLVDMYDRFIPEEKRLEILPLPVRADNPQDNAVQAVGGAAASAEIARAHHQAVKRPKKKKTCPVAGCTGQGHKNLRRWAEGHTTRAGCPIHHHVAPPADL